MLVESMRLPNANAVIVEERKIAGYLLNLSHPGNGGKAKFFTGLGFLVTEWQALAEALREHAEASEVVGCVESDHGCKYILDGAIRGPGGSNASLRSVWIVELNTSGPRLVTAYPHQ